VCQAQDEAKYRTEEISFNAGKFFVTGSLILPDSGSNFTAAVMCWGSGPTDRKAFIKNSTILKTFIKSGIAFFVEDKPGSGESTGEFSNDSIFFERAEILKKEVELLKIHPLINPKKIGLYGSSQAGYVMPIVLNISDDIAFMIAWSAPVMNSLEQSAYLVKMQALCGGYGKEESGRIYNYFIQRRTAKTYKEYLEAAEYLDRHPVIIELGWGGVTEESEFSPAEEGNISFLNPEKFLEKVRIPVLAVFGEKDTQIDPIQGMEGYKRALTKAGNSNFRTVMIKGVDHNMRETITGSLKEQKETYGKPGQGKLSAEFVKLIESWIRDFK